MRLALSSNKYTRLALSNTVRGLSLIMAVCSADNVGIKAHMTEYCAIGVHADMPGHRLRLGVNTGSMEHGEHQVWNRHLLLLNRLFGPDCWEKLSDPQCQNHTCNDFSILIVHYLLNSWSLRIQNIRRSVAQSQTLPPRHNIMMQLKSIVRYKPFNQDQRTIPNYKDRRNPNNNPDPFKRYKPSKHITLL